MHGPGDSGGLSTVEYVLLCYRYTSVNIYLLLCCLRLQCFFCLKLAVFCVKYCKAHTILPCEKHGVVRV